MGVRREMRSHFLNDVRIEFKRNRRRLCVLSKAINETKTLNFNLKHKNERKCILKITIRTFSDIIYRILSVIKEK